MAAQELLMQDRFRNGSRSRCNLTNNGVINVTNGIGIEGAGHIINQGTIEVTGTGTDVGNTGVGSAEVGSIKIESNGDVIINDKYVGIGGTLTTAGAQK